jgi:hypothetical protein
VEKKSGQWEGRHKIFEIMINTIFAPESASPGTVAGYIGPAPIDLLAVKGKKITLEECKR